MALSAPMQPFLRITSSDNIVPCGNRKHFLEYCRTHSSILWTSTHSQLRVHRKMPERPSSIQRKCREISCCAQNSTGSCGAKNDSEPIQDSPWEGAIIYKRSASQTHYEYCTTLERLGLSKVSSQLSRSTASSMGIRVTRAVTDFPSGTPVQISVDVTRKKKNLKLDGIIRTFITLQCNRCGEPTAERVFSNFCLLLTEKPVKEATQMTLRIDLHKDKNTKVANENDEDEEDDEEFEIDLDDQMHFPLEEKEIDISKYIRDIVHLEITISAVCDINCKGLCLKCGTNLNRSICKCAKQSGEVVYGSFKKCKKQIQEL